MEPSNQFSVEPYENIKTSRFQLVAYPSDTFQHRINLTSKINNIFGNLSYTDRNAISSWLEVSDSHLQTQLSSSVQNGLPELIPGEKYKPTNLFRKVYKPLPTLNLVDTLVECLENPELYKSIIKKYDGATLPMQAGLATIPWRNHKVYDQASELVVKIIIENPKVAGLLANDNSF